MRTVDESELGGGASGNRARAVRQQPDLVCLSHLRWNFVFQRPQHLMVRWAQQRRVFFFEEPVWEEGLLLPGRLAVAEHVPNVFVTTPHLPAGLDEAAAIYAQRQLIDELFTARRIEEHVLWYYTPMALPFTRHLRPLARIYDCMDELSAFSGASPQLRARETDLLALADLVFTGGHSLYEAKRQQHRRIYPFPSSLDRAHFARAREAQVEPADQAGISRPRLGFFGVIDERMDLGLIDGVARARPEWQIVLVGPVVKIDPASLPRHDNIHYLGMKSYDELPGYLAGWDVALLPFARNESTRFISPTKTPEYLAAGRPVVSTSIRDVVRPYGEQGLVRIADSVADFVSATEAALADDRDERLLAVDRFLSRTSWDRTWDEMRRLVEGVSGPRQRERRTGRTRDEAALR